MKINVYVITYSILLNNLVINFVGTPSFMNLNDGYWITNYSVSAEKCYISVNMNTQWLYFYLLTITYINLICFSFHIALNCISNRSYILNTLKYI